MKVRYLPAGTVELSYGERVRHQMSVRAAKRLAADILAVIPEPKGQRKRDERLGTREQMMGQDQPRDAVREVRLRAVQEAQDGLAEANGTEARLDYLRRREGEEAWS